MKTRGLNLDRISTLPENVSGKILSLMPIQDALRTSILSKKWQYSWRSMPKLVFTANMVKVDANCDCGELKKYKVVNAILHVLLLHNCPAILVFESSVLQLDIYSEFAQITSYLARGNTVKKLYFINHDSLCYRKLPVSFFSLLGLKHILLENCTFEPPQTVEIFSRLKNLIFLNVNVSSQMLQRFLSKCPLLDSICLLGDEQKIDFAAGGMPYKLPTPLAHLKYLCLNVCLMDHNEMSFALCIIRSSPVLEDIIIEMSDNENLFVPQTPTNFLDPEGYSDLKLDHLETLKIEQFTNLPIEMDFVKLIMAKSPVLKKVLIELHSSVSGDEELKMYKSLVLRPFLRASPSAKLIIERRKTYSV